MKTCTWLAVLIVATLSGIEAHADSMIHEVKGGLLHHDTDGLWSNSRRESGADVNLELIFTPKMDFFGGAVRPATGASINMSGDTSKAYLAARWEGDLSDNTFLALGIGGAIHSGYAKPPSNDRKALGSDILFYFPIEAGYRLDEHKSVSLFFDHVSNAWLASPNEGMDTLGVRVGYKF